jgi:hypothetical protein
VFSERGGAGMKKNYEKPELKEYESLNKITAGLPSEEPPVN